jgi:predicted N-acetyltransferase YhbS
VLRIAEPRDLDACVALTEEFSRTHAAAPWPWTGRLDGVADQIEDAIDEGRAIVALCDDGDVIGTASIMEAPYGAAALANLAVRESFRGTGIGRELVEGAASLAELRGWSPLTALIWQGGALEFYDKTMTRAGVLYVKET